MYTKSDSEIKFINKCNIIMNIIEEHLLLVKELWLDYGHLSVL